MQELEAKLFIIFSVLAIFVSPVFAAQDRFNSTSIDAMVSRLAVSVGETASSLTVALESATSQISDRLETAIIQVSNEMDRSASSLLLLDSPVETQGGNSFFFGVLAAMLGIAVFAIGIQSYWRHGSWTQVFSEFRHVFQTRKRDVHTEGTEIVRSSFWDPVSDFGGSVSARRLDPLDLEYVKNLFRLGYSAEAERTLEFLERGGRLSDLKNPAADKPWQTEKANWTPPHPASWACAEMQSSHSMLGSILTTFGKKLQKTTELLKRDL